MNFSRMLLGYLGYGFFILLSAILVVPYMAVAYLVFLKENLDNTCDWVNDPAIELGLFDYLNERSKEKYHD
jgi:hypothetical protein